MFIAWHYFLAIYKNIVILIATIFFISADKQNVVVIIIFISTIYISVLFILRAVETKVVNHYEEYKYEFVRVFEESMTSSEIIRIYDVKL